MDIEKMAKERFDKASREGRDKEPWTDDGRDNLRMEAAEESADFINYARIWEKWLDHRKLLTQSIENHIEEAILHTLQANMHMDIAQKKLEG